MKMNGNSRRQSLILATTLGIGLGFAFPVFAQQDVRDVGTFILDLNGKGLIPLGTLRGSVTKVYDINDVGQVVGMSTTATGERHAFITGPNGAGMTDLGTLGGPYSIATSINYAGQVVGEAYMDVPGHTHPFITGPNGVGMTDLGPQGEFWSSATGINNAGQVAANRNPYDPYDFRDHPFITGPNGVGMTDLNSLVELPAGTFISQAIGINNAGQVGDEET